MSNQWIKDLEWRKMVREYFKMENLMPEMYSDIWKSGIGKRIAFSIAFRRAFIMPLESVLDPILKWFNKYLYERGQRMCARGYHSWITVDEQVSVNGYSKRTTRSCTRCPAVKVVRR